MRLGSRGIVWLLGAALIATVASASLACEGQPGTGPFTVLGWITDLAGQPVPGVPVTLIPLASGDQPDFENGVFGVEERDSHLVRSNEDGLFVMPQVFDYPEVTTHRYQVVHAGLAGLAASPGAAGACALEGEIVDLTGLERGMVKVHLTARPAGTVRLTLRDGSGRPYTGPRAVLLLGEGPALAATAQFDQGTAELGPLPAGQLRIGLLDGELGYFVQQRAAHEQRPLTDYLLSSGGVSLVSLAVDPGEVAEVAFTLP
ncbi:MAG: hypothetical protein ACM3RP_07580 [Chitinophagales bacterium]